jgi:hypothetical protein
VDFNPNELLGPLGTHDQRLAALDKLTQSDPDNPQAESYCGPTALLAAAIYGGGGKGVEMLMSQIQTDSAKLGEGDKGRLNPDDVQAMAALRKKIDSGAQVNQADMQLVEAKLYSSMRSQQDKNPDVSQANKDSDGINGLEMQDYIASHPQLAKMMKDNHQAVSFIDNTGSGSQGHYVLDIDDPARGGSGGYDTVFDPLKRKDGDLVTDPNAVDAYTSTKHTNFGE